MEAHDKVAEKTEIYVPYNILLLDPDSANQAIMKYPEVCLLTTNFLCIIFLSFIVITILTLPFSRSKLLSMHLGILGVFHGPRTTKRRKMRISLTGFKLCLAFRWNSFLSDLFLYVLSALPHFTCGEMEIFERLDLITCSVSWGCQ